MADIDRYFGIQLLLTSNFNVLLIASLHNAFASLFNKTETTVGCPYSFKSITSFQKIHGLLGLGLVILIRYQQNSTDNIDTGIKIGLFSNTVSLISELLEELQIKILNCMKTTINSKLIPGTLSGESCVDVL